MNKYVFIQTFHHNGNLITEQGTGEQNPLYQLAIDSMLTSATTRKQNRSTRHLQHPQISSNSSTIAADNSTGTYIIHYSIELIAFCAKYTLINNCNFNLVYRYSLSVNLTWSITVWRLPDVIVTVVLCPWRWVIMTPETCRPVVR